MSYFSCITFKAVNIDKTAKLFSTTFAAVSMVIKVDL